MRYFTSFILLAIAGFGARAQATPFEPAVVPEQVEAVGHLDVDALRKTQVFTALGGQKAIVADVSESAGVVTANARAELGSADAVQKAKSIVDGLRTLASLSGEPAQRALLDGVTVTANGLALEVVAKLPVTELAKAIEPKN